MKEQSTPGGNYHWIIFCSFCSETNKYQENCMFFVIQSSTSNNVFFKRFINTRDNGVSSIGYLITIVNPDTIEEYMNDVPIFYNEQWILMIPMNNSPIPIRNDSKKNNLNVVSFKKEESRLDVSHYLVQNSVENSVIVKMSYLISISTFCCNDFHGSNFSHPDPFYYLY